MVKFNKKQKTLTLSRHLSIENATEMKSVFEQALTSANSLKIMFDSIERIDITCIQLIQALQNDATNQGKNISLCTPLPDEVTELIKCAGLSHLEFWQTAA